jgi:putative nucleotidyltransferase with HDIG domain
MDHGSLQRGSNADGMCGAFLYARQRFCDARQRGDRDENSARNQADAPLWRAFASPIREAHLLLLGRMHTAEPQDVTSEHPAQSRAALRELFTKVSESCDLPPLPAVAVRAIALARDPNVRADQLVRVVSTDAALAARVVSIARSVRYMRREAPRTLVSAIQTVGFQALRRILIAASARAAYRAADAVAQALWEHALATALAADELSQRAGEPRGGNAFIGGLMHDIGKLVLHLSDGKNFEVLDHDDEVREIEIFGVTHEQVGACLAEHWGLEDDVVWAILSHHRRPEGSSVLADRIARADRIACRMGHGCGRQIEPSDSGELAEVAEVVMKSFESERTIFA